MPSYPGYALVPRNINEMYATEQNKIHTPREITAEMGRGGGRGKIKSADCAVTLVCNRDLINFHIPTVVEWLATV